ncbi:MAG: malate dehydrogenase [Candidatus Mcinerneyibacterium aminivorans]|uniref:Malate dehydrogenase n=1 Tax=Candidatus Mcinerneyibacterium aminivorans TaxID=2703815 RepID=A0A5D0MJS4_9BACT|nr:MAG: malate dehydrogenase [Candidatus Mcinerneyibacterium aminivorans]
MDEEKLKKKALEYHSKPFPGKIRTFISKKCKTQTDLSLAYTPGVAYPSIEIKKNKQEAYKFTNKKNLVGVISNGTAVLGLGDIGPLSSKPVMEGKGVLFKKFADIDVFDIEINEKDPDKFVEIVKSMEPTFGGINLEDIKAPECFYIEEKLKSEMDIPVFHDDQHGTAVIVGAGLLNALEIAEKDIKNIKVVFSGAGAAGMACAEFIVALGVKKENIFMFDKKGALNEKRKDLIQKQRRFCHNRYKNLNEAFENADVFIGVSAGGIVSEDMVKKMNSNPILFALANPYPEIDYNKATGVRNDLIMATGRSDFPNQVNNVLGFPFLFRGALDVFAKAITENMKIAASKALAEIAKKEVPGYIKKIYKEDLIYGRKYIIPKPFDKRILVEVASAVAEAAVNDGVARRNVDIKKYKSDLKKITSNMFNQ